MDLLAITYKNIGPFINKLVTLDFKKGKYLIKSPIGTGKSFLFFDGPLFGLYGSSRSVGRAILSAKAKEGFVKLLFEDRYGQKWFVKRIISRTSSGGEKVASTLFKLNKDDIVRYLEKPFEDIINFGLDIEPLISPYLEGEEFKSARELQKNLELLIPPKEVFLTTSFLMQDSENIFEMIPSERIRVFKEMFGLLDIDMAKERVADQRKEIRGQIKALEDTTIANEKLKSMLDSLYGLLKNLMALSILRKAFSLKLKKFIDDYEILGDKINIDGFVLDIALEDIEPLEEFIDSESRRYQHLKALQDEKKVQLIDLKTQLKELEQKLNQLRQAKLKIESEISKVEQLNLEELDEKREKLIDQMRALDKLIDWERLNIKRGDYTQVFSFFKEMEEEGKRLNQQVKSIKDKVDTLNKQKSKVEAILDDLKKGGKRYNQLLYQETKNQEKIIRGEIEALNIRLEGLKKNEKLLNSRLDELKKRLKKEKKVSFWCDQINSECPLLERIGKEVFDVHDSQLSLEIEEIETNLKEIHLQMVELEEKKEILKEKIVNIEKEVDISSYVEKEISQIKANWDLNELESQIKKLNEDLEAQEHLLKIKREEFKKLGGLLFKNKIWPQWEIITKQLRDLDEQVNILKAKKKEKDSLLAKVQKIEGEVGQLEDYKNNLNEQITQINTTLDELNTKISAIDLKEIKIADEALEQIKTIIIQINDLIKDFGWRQKELSKLKEKEQILKNLINILGKELMVVVLQNFLPILEDQINALLAEVVDFQLRFMMKETKSGEQQLDIKIFDIRGEREVKSLSGGQKVVLRLAWILSVSRILNNKFLFLDETINNLDVEAIGRVARMIKHFLDKSPIEKFYVVTHSSQIQEMDIWDKTIGIPNV